MDTGGNIYGQRREYLYGVRGALTRPRGLIYSTTASTPSPKQKKNNGSTQRATKTNCQTKHFSEMGKTIFVLGSTHLDGHTYMQASTDMHTCKKITRSALPNESDENNTRQHTHTHKNIEMKCPAPCSSHALRRADELSMTAKGHSLVCDPYLCVSSRQGVRCGGRHECTAVQGITK